MTHANVHPFADLSTAHLPEGERAYLHNPLNYIPLVVRPHDYGFFVHVPLGAEWQELLASDPFDWSVLPALRQCLEWAGENGCWWINFDTDAHTTEDLPNYRD